MAKITVDMPTLLFVIFWILVIIPALILYLANHDQELSFLYQINKRVKNIEDGLPTLEEIKNSNQEIIKLLKEKI